MDLSYGSQIKKIVTYILDKENIMKYLRVLRNCFVSLLWLTAMIQDGDNDES